MPDADAPTTRYEVTDGIAVLTLDRPERLNAIGGTMLRELREHLDQATSDAAVRALVLTGEGRGFCAGGDLGSLSGTNSGTGAAVAGIREHLHLAELLHDMPKPTIAAVNGAAAGAGMAFACACDLRIASETAFFVTAFLAAGQTGDYGLSWTLPRIIGMGRARELSLTNRRVHAEEALGIGLVSAVVPGDELLHAARAMVATAAGAPPLTVVGLKANLLDAEHLTLAEILDRESERFDANMATEDAKEAARAFVEKRPPVYRGR